MRIELRKIFLVLGIIFAIIAIWLSYTLIPPLLELNRINQALENIQSEDQGYHTKENGYNETLKYGEVLK